MVIMVIIVIMVIMTIMVMIVYLFIYLVLCHTYTLSYLFGSRIDVFNALEQSCHLEVGAQPTEEKLDVIR